MDKLMVGATNKPVELTANDLVCKNAPLLVVSATHLEAIVVDREFLSKDLRAAPKRAERHFVIIVV